MIDGMRDGGGVVHACVPDSSLMRCEYNASFIIGPLALVDCVERVHVSVREEDVTCLSCLAPDVLAGRW